MSYVVLARKYRPGAFDSMSGQEHVTRTIKNGIVKGRIPHAYLFTGPRGVGKTSIARIVSKALNCKHGPTAEPCLECVPCTEITRGNSLAVREIDGASHNGVDNIRELIESFRSLPPPGYRYKIYIIDEVHMLSTAAFNALLKSIEEPPKNTVFILATTEVHKIPETVISRCQRHDLRALSSESMVSTLTSVVKQEQLLVPDDVLRLIARYADGSMRDALSLLERVISYCNDQVTSASANEALGGIGKVNLIAISQAIIVHDSEKSLQLMDQIFSQGVDPALFIREFVTHWRDLLIVKFGGEKLSQGLGLTAEELTDISNQVRELSTADLQDLVDLVQASADSALRSYHPRYALEALVVRLAERVPVLSFQELLATKPGQPQSSARNQGGSSNPNPAAANHSIQAASGSGSNSPSIQNRLAALSGTSQPGSSETAATTGTVPERLYNAHAALTASGVKHTDRLPPQVKRALASPENQDLESSQTNAAPPNFDWAGFVQFVGINGQPMLTEQLKRFSAELVEASLLNLKGPEFSLAYLKAEGNLERVRALLTQYSGQSDWKIVLKSSGERARSEEGSPHQNEAERVERERVKHEQNLQDHPTVQRLLKVFPGSTIESVKSKPE